MGKAFKAVQLSKKGKMLLNLKAFVVPTSLCLKYLFFKNFPFHMEHSVLHDVP